LDIRIHQQTKLEALARVDGTLVGLYDAKRHFLYISSKSFYDAQGAKLEKQSHTE
jgi:hypothetical protein